jgi:mono/diheme cytochrome c family protein
MNFNKIIIFSIFILFAFGCSETSPIDLVAEQNVLEKITYQNKIKQIINTNCISCHGNIPTNGAPMSLDNYANVKDAVLNLGLINRINLDQSNSSAMPLGGPKLLQSQIDSIVKWQNNGFID